MSLNRVLHYLNWFIAFLVLLFAFFLYWFFYRVLPQKNGSVVAPVSRTARIVRDGLGVPHITSDTFEDALFLQGYATAQDRLFQMDIIRRVASGTVSQIIGPATITLDQESRRLRMRRVAEQAYKKMDPRVRPLFAAYARGVNHFIETHQRSLPIEFTVLSYDPAPWTVVDSIVVGMQMSRDLTSSWKDEVQKAALLKTGDKALVEQLFDTRAGVQITPGSNAWAISGKLTATGKPILANDTHLEYGVPSTWHMVQIASPQVDVQGFALPGLPGVIIGHNERIAWGITNLGYDVQDLYVEKLDVRTGRYLYKGQIQQAVSERELIPVKGGKPVEFTNLVTVHGPVWSTEGGQITTIRWMSGDPDAFSYPIFELDAATNWSEFRTALSHFNAPAQNFVYADVDGNIGYQVAGMLPQRKNYRGDVPTDGSTGENEWDGFIPFEKLPTAFNPPSGMLVTANQNPFGPGFEYSDNGVYAPSFRAGQIQAMLKHRSGWKPAEMVTVQKDVYSSFHHFLAGQLAAAVNKKAAGNNDLKQAADLLRSWNGQMEIGSSAAMIVSLTSLELRSLVAERASPAKAAGYEHRSASPVVMRLLQQRPQGWFQDWDALLVQALEKGLAAGREQQGRNPAQWNYGKLIALQLRHPILGRDMDGFAGSLLSYFHGWFNIGPVAMSGSEYSVKQITRPRRIGPSMRFVANLANWDQSLMNVTMGESGQPLSNHYKDQWQHYYTGESYPAAFANVTGDELKVVPDSAPTTK